MFRAADRLTRELDVSRLSDVASALHVNFYGNWYTSQVVAGALAEVESFLNEPEPLELKESNPYPAGSIKPIRIQRRANP